MTECESNSEHLPEEGYTYNAEEGQSLSEAVVHAVSAYTGRETISANANETSEALDPLFDTIDPDALDSLFQSSGNGESMLGTVEFWYGGCEVTVDSSGFVIVTKR